MTGNGRFLLLPTSSTAVSRTMRGEEPRPPPMFPDGGPFVPFVGMPPPPGWWVGPPVDGSGTWGPPPLAEHWRMQQRQPYYPLQDYAISNNSNLVQELRVELDESLAEGARFASRVAKHHCSTRSTAKPR